VLSKVIAGQLTHILHQSLYYEWRQHCCPSTDIGHSSLNITRGVAIFAKAFMGLPAQQAAKTTRPLMPAAAPAVLLLSLTTRQGVVNIVLAMTRRDFGKPAFSLRKNTLRENTCSIASGDYSTPVSQR